MLHFHKDEITIALILIGILSFNILIALNTMLFIGYHMAFTYTWVLLALTWTEIIIWHKELLHMNKTLDYYNMLRKMDSDLPF